MTSPHDFTHPANRKPAGIGISEQNLHPASGLRDFAFKARPPQDINFFTTEPITVTNQTDWTDLIDVPIKKQFLETSMTPCIVFTNDTLLDPLGQVLRVRITGFDASGVAMVEETPALVHNANASIVPGSGGTGSWYWWASKCFSRITKVEYSLNDQSTTAVMQLSIGAFWVPNTDAFTNAPAQTSIGDSVSLNDGGSFYNQGFGIPIKTDVWRPQVSGGAAMVGLGQDNIIGGRIIEHSDGIVRTMTSGTINSPVANIDSVLVTPDGVPIDSGFATNDLLLTRRTIRIDDCANATWNGIWESFAGDAVGAILLLEGDSMGRANVAGSGTVVLLDQEGELGPLQPNLTVSGLGLGGITLGAQDTFLGWAGDIFKVGAVMVGTAAEVQKHRGRKSYYNTAFDVGSDGIFESLLSPAFGADITFEANLRSTSGYTDGSTTGAYPVINL